MASVEGPDALSQPHKNNDVVATRSDADIDASFVELAKVIGSRHVPSLSERELEILDLYDQLSELALERNLLEAQSDVREVAVADGDLTKQLAEAERECLDTKASFTLTNSIVESVLQADPVLKAVHAGANANPLERMLHPLIDQRDVLSIIQANLSSELQSTQDGITLAQCENMKAMQKNKELTATLMDLTKELKPVDVKALEDSELKSQIQELQLESKEARQTYRIMKSLAAGVVVGSGVDWASDDALQDLVLDSED